MPKSKFDPRLNVGNGMVLEKNTENTFASTNLEKHLKDQGINELYILGQDGVACINKTTRAALDLGFKVHLVSDAIVSGAPKKWEKLQLEFAKKANCDFVPSF
ncbi:Isochorismatase family protein [compost metagenome]